MLMHDSYFSCPYIKVCPLSFSREKRSAALPSLQTKYLDRVPQIIALIKKELYTQTSQNNKQDAASGNCQYDPQAFLAIIEEPRYENRVRTDQAFPDRSMRRFRKALTEFQLDREKIHHTKQLDESPQARASFVINTLMAVAKARSLT